MVLGVIRIPLTHFVLPQDGASPKQQGFWEKRPKHRPHKSRLTGTGQARPSGTARTTGLSMGFWRRREEATGPDAGVRHAREFPATTAATFFKEVSGYPRESASPSTVTGTGGRPSTWRDRPTRSRAARPGSRPPGNLIFSHRSQVLHRGNPPARAAVG